MKKRVVLLLIIGIAFFLRFFQLGINPPSLTWDEVAWGYNAYSLGIDGRDEFGRLLPLNYLESFGDFKPPVYAYLDILPVKLFGLNEFAVRFPSAFFGVLTVLLTYFFTKRIFPNKELVSIIATAILAISPWHINLSRAAFEANIATFFLCLGIWTFLEWIRGKKWWCLMLSGVSFVLSMYTFNTARIIAPLLILFLGVAFRSQLIKSKKHVFVTAIICIVLFIPLANFMITPQARLRFQEVNIFSDISIIERTNQEIVNSNNAWWSKIIHNRRFVYVQEYIRHYFDNFSLRFLFIKGDGNPKFSTQDVGQLYLWELPFFVIGILLLFRKREGYWWIIPVWMLLGIIPAATARETPHALRIETTLPTFQIITAYGFVALAQKISNIKYQISNIQIKSIIFFLIFFIIIFNFLYYFHGYYVHYPRIYSGEWQYGYKEALNYVQSAESKYEAVHITEKLGRPYAYTLFYLQYDPKLFRKEAIIQREAMGFVHVKGFGKYRFSANLRTLPMGKRILYVDLPANVPSKVKILKRFFLQNGETVFVAYTR